MSRKYARIAWFGCGALNVVKLAKSPGNFVRSNSLAFGHRLGDFCLKHAFGICQPLPLFEQVLLKLRTLSCIELVDGVFDFALSIGFRFGEGVLHRFRYLRFADTFGTLEKQSREFAYVHDGAKHAYELAVVSL